MISRHSSKQSGFTLLELMVTTAVFVVLSAATFTGWVTLQKNSANITVYANRQADQTRVVDYLKRDIRRAATITILNGASVAAPGSPGTELRVTVADYYADSLEEDNPRAPQIANTPVLSAGVVSYGTPLTIRYFVLGGAVVRQENGVSRTISDAVGAFTLTFINQGNGAIRSRVFYNQPFNNPGTRVLRREIDAVFHQRFTLQ